MNEEPKVVSAGMSEKSLVEQVIMDAESVLVMLQETGTFDTQIETRNLAESLAVYKAAKSCPPSEARKRRRDDN